MSTVVKNIKWIMLVAGLVTCTTIAAVIAPQDTLFSMFASNLTEPLANLIVRSWGFLVFLMGALLIYGAFNQGSRLLCIITAGVSKVTFLVLILLFGMEYIETLWITVVFDMLVITLLGIFVFSTKAIAK